MTTPNRSLPSKKQIPSGWQWRRGIGWFYRLMGFPGVYEFMQAILSPGSQRLLRGMKEKIFKNSHGYILDVGCGPRMNLPAPLGVIVGVDVNEPYLLAYTGGYLDQDPELPFQRASFHRRFGYQADSQSLPFKGRRFNEIRATGIMHHMDADTVRHTLLEMRRCMKSNGRIVLFEPVWPKRGWARPLAWLILRFDRGSHMRTEKKFRALLTKTLKGNWQFQRMTYAYTGLECLWAVFFDKSFPRHPIIFS